MTDRSGYPRDRSRGDLLSEVLNLTGVRAAQPARLSGSGRWGLHFRGYAYTKVGTVMSGSGWLRIEGEEAVRLAAGDCYVLSPGRPYAVLSDPGVSTEDGHAAFTHTRISDARCGSDADRADTTLLGCGFELDDTTAALVGTDRPALTRIDASTLVARVVAGTLRLLAEETAADRPGRDAMRAYLAQILFLQVARQSLRPSGDPQPAWLGAIADPQIAAALALIHRRPAHAWTVAGLAAEVSMSRTVFATRFRALVGLAPLEYLRWRRITVATQSLADGRRTVASVAAESGYSSPSAFSVAYKRVTGHSPAATRTFRPTEPAVQP